MQVGTYIDGRPLGYDEASHQFDVGGTPISTADLTAYDSAGQITWVNEETRVWAHTFFSASAPMAAPAVSATPEKKKTATWIVVVAVIAAFLVLGCCAALGVSALIAPARYVSDTSESVTSSSTLVPDTGATEETATGGLSSEEIAYAQDVSAITADVAGGLTELGRLLTTDPKGVFTDKSVKADVFDQMEIIKDGYTAVQELDPPVRFQPAHEDLLASMKLFDESMDELSDGIENVDAKKVTHASELMMEGSRKMQDAMLKLQSVQD